MFIKIDLWRYTNMLVFLFLDRTRINHRVVSFHHDMENVKYLDNIVLLKSTEC